MLVSELYTRGSAPVPSGELDVVDPSRDEGEKTIAENALPVSQLNPDWVLPDRADVVVYEDPAAAGRPRLTGLVAPPVVYGEPVLDTRRVGLGETPPPPGAP